MMVSLCATFAIIPSFAEGNIVAWTTEPAVTEAGGTNPPNKTDSAVLFDGLGAGNESWARSTNFPLSAFTVVTAGSNSP